jgi:hypothetical protein
MRAIEIEVMSKHYTGQLLIESADKDNSLFVIYLGENILGKAQPVRIQNDTRWYSHEITDKELLDQIGEWIEFHYSLTEKSFKPIYGFRLFNIFFLLSLSLLFVC